MASGHLTYKPGTGHLAYSENGHLALNCGGCSGCINGYTNTTITVSTDASSGYCLADGTYSPYLISSDGPLCIVYWQEVNRKFQVCLCYDPVTFVVSQAIIEHQGFPVYSATGSLDPLPGGSVQATAQWAMSVDCDNQKMTGVITGLVGIDQTGSGRDDCTPYTASLVLS